MKNLKIYEVSVEGLICHGSATSRKEFTEIYGAGDTAPRDASRDYFVSDREAYRLGLPESSPERLYSDLIMRGWGSVEAEYITSLLRAALDAQNR